MMKAIDLPVIRKSNSEFGDKDCIGVVAVSYDKYSCIYSIIYNMRYYQCCCGFKSVVLKVADRNNLIPTSMIYSL